MIFVAERLPGVRTAVDPIPTLSSLRYGVTHLLDERHLPRDYGDTPKPASRLEETV